MSRSLERVITDDEADLELLSLANHKRKFGIALGLPMDAPKQFAFERGIDNEWFTLVDVSQVAAVRGVVLRIFRLTDAGMARLTELRAQ